MDIQTFTTVRTARTPMEAGLLIGVLEQAGLHPVEFDTSSHYSIVGADIEYPVRVPAAESVEAREVLNSYDSNAAATSPLAIPRPRLSGAAIRRRAAAIATSLAVVAACVFVVRHIRNIPKHKPVPVRGPIFLSVIGFTTNWISDEEYFSALVRMTNTGINPVFYYGDGFPDSPGYATRHHESSGWRFFGGGFSCGILVREFQLDPSRSITFKAVILKGDKPCQVTLQYWDDKGTQRLTNTAATEVFEFPSTLPARRR